MIQITNNEYEGVVRTQAVSLITTIYENQKVPSNQLESIYEVLAVAAIHDLFWEVKVKAIEFWHCVIKRQLQYQGVIDGTFPSVTFSKENKKIVTLTQKEITLRLSKVLLKLSSFGCLGVLLASLDDQDDIIVVRKGVEVIKSITEFLDKYNYWEELKETPNKIPPARVAKPTEEKPPTNENDLDSKMNIADAIASNSDDVIQSIVSSQDINLLSEAYENHMSVDARPPTQDQCIKENNDQHFQSFRVITPEIFLDKMKTTNLTELLQNRTRWMAQTESFSSLLNDMSYSLQAEHTLDADCY